MRPVRYALLLLLTASALATSALAQPTGATLVTSALVRPLGLTTDGAGRIWTAETGTGANDGRISVVLPDGQRFPFLVGIPSATVAEGVRSISHLAFAGQELWFTASVSHTASSLYRISTAGFTPGDAPRTMADVAVTVDVWAFLDGEGYFDTNPHGIAVGPDGALYFTDAGANALLRYDPTAGMLSVLVAFPDIPTGTNPPTVQAVPTGIVSADGQLYVATLTGFPYLVGVARVYAVALDGTFAVHQGGLTALTDLARDPRDGALTVVQHGVFQFPPGQFQPGSGRTIRLDDDRELASGFDFATGAAYDGAGVLYVCTLPGNLYRVESNPVSNEPAPEVGGFALHAARPNPFRGATTLTYEVSTTTGVRLAVYDVLGREVAVFVDGERAAGRHEAILDAGSLAPGVYVVRLTAGGLAATRRLTVAR